MARKSPAEKKELVADWPALTRTFIRPESDAAKSTLIKYMEQILFGLHDFLKTHVGFTKEVDLPLYFHSGQRTSLWFSDHQ